MDYLFPEYVQRNMFPEHSGNTLGTTNQKLIFYQFPNELTISFQFQSVSRTFSSNSGNTEFAVLFRRIYLEAIAAAKDTRIQKQSNSIQGAVVIDDTAKVAKSSFIGPNVVIGPNCQIGNNVRIKNSVIFEGSVIMDGSLVSGSIVGWHSKLGRWSRLENMCILGEDVEIKSEVALNGVTVCPHKGVKESIVDSPGKIIL